MPASELSQKLGKHDGDGDGAVTLTEAAQFLEKNRIGGAWLSQALAKSVWKSVESIRGDEVKAIPVDALAQYLHEQMGKPARPDRRPASDGQPGEPAEAGSKGKSAAKSKIRPQVRRPKKPKSS